MIENYEQVKKAAVGMMRSDSGGAWKLADAVLAAVPETTDRAGVGGRGNSTPARGVSLLVSELVTLLSADGVTTPKGEFYTASSLASMRETAMAWPPETRHPEAAYRTHQEAGGKDSPARKALSALCALSRGEKAKRPAGIEEEAWRKTVERVTVRKHGFAVNANDLRVALNRPINNPGRALESRDIPAIKELLAADPVAREAAADMLLGTPEGIDLMAKGMANEADAQIVLGNKDVNDAVMNAQAENNRRRSARSHTHSVDRGKVIGGKVVGTISNTILILEVEQRLDILLNTAQNLDDEEAVTIREWLIDSVLVKVNGCLEILSMRGHEISPADFE